MEELEKLEEQVKEKLQDIGKMIKNELPEGFGFALLSFYFNAEGQLMYVSNAKREDVVKAMEEFIEKTKENYGNDTEKY